MAATLGTVAVLADKTDQARFLLRVPITLDDSYPATNGYPLSVLLAEIDARPYNTILDARMKVFYDGVGTQGYVGEYDAATGGLRIHLYNTGAEVANDEDLSAVVNAVLMIEAL